MSRKEAIFVIFLLVCLLGIIPNIKADDKWKDSGEKLGVKVTIEEQELKIKIVEEYVDLGEITKRYITNSSFFNITNKGTVDALIQPVVDSSDEIFSNLMISSKKTSGYNLTKNFIGKVPKSSTYKEENTESFWIKLNLTEYEGNVTGDLSTDIIFYVMSDD